ncbi:MAG TPA: DinB family protein [Candidatus Kryptonia bacterium]
MNEVNRIVKELREMYEGKPWHGSSVKEILSGVTHTMAADKQANGGHSIWEMVLHISSWIDISTQRLGGIAVEPPPEQDWPAVKETSKEAWNRTIKQLDSREKKLEEAVSKLNENRLEQTAPGRDHGVRFMLQGVIYHNVYHSAQIAMAKKTLGK